VEDCKYPSIDKFIEGLKALDIELSQLQLKQFIDYYEMLVEWNDVMNLTAIIEFDEVIQKHFIDSLSLVKAYRLTEEKVLDMGTGAGFPGIPLKIVFPEIKITLLDSLNKRINFLNAVIEKLQLNDITAVHGRAEDFGHDINYREAFDICVSRAVAKIATLAEYCVPYVKKGGYFIPYKSGKIEDELQAGTRALKFLGAELVKTVEFTLPDTDMERSLVIIKKNSSTSKKYPRSAGKPTKEPLA
jgi:16S rRNA (guanine527-N7)-methyltransferase